MNFLLTQDHMGLEISKCYSHSFHPISAKPYDGIGYHSGIQTVTFVGNRLSVKILWQLWYFKLVVIGKNVKCAVSWKRMIVERTGWKFGTWGLRSSICGVLFMSDSLSSGRDHSVNFPEFPILRFQKATSPRVFLQFQPNIRESMVIRGEYRLLFILAICQIDLNLKISHLKLHCHWP